MLSFKQFLNELKLNWKIPNAPGTTPIPPDQVRLYHQTSEPALSNIRRTGIEPRQPYEGPKGIYADPKGFYGDPSDRPTVEFSVHKDEWKSPFVHRDKVEPEKIIATHKPWHNTVRYIDSDPEMRSAVERGEYDYILDKDMIGTKEAKAVRFIKHRAAALRNKQ